ncbi:MAG: transglycosylase SLT domain-containing protein [Prevotella sp.]|nr:transglycosylase SLT domain-containing protein [Prevotella sp.]
MPRLNKYCTFIVPFLLLFASCTRKEKPKTTPWGTVITDSESSDRQELSEHLASGSDTLSAITPLKEIITNGELIVLTISGPDTYYDYHGHGLGVQYMMCEQFAEQLGITTRTEVCRDTLELIEKLRKGYGDVVAVQLPKRKFSKEGLRFCGAKDKNGKTSWAVLQGNRALGDSLDHWFRADMPDKTLAHEDYLLSLRITHSASFNPQQSSFNLKNSDYNALFQRYAGMAGLDWKLLAAQCYQESAFDAGAVSWAGACGLMQLMPSTAARLGLSREQIFVPEKNIEAGARYMGMLMNTFSDVSNRNERINFALAAYNGGAGHVRDAMALARKYGGNQHAWSSVSQYILKLSASEYYQDPVVQYGYMRGTETVNYVSSIRKRYGY